ncbi:hypothetical protein TEPIDINF_001650 [Tepidibacillus infernus]|uniref:Uncharacterized protein n=1 Tax=Tepidibacillus decaturensis TaxID=1413211 RepID=A0A135L572_9BACI|nr:MULTISPECIES: hypothetical protein [Tepidibacillus]KXG44162.1 hypothetical protein U473_09230 [Tepidibacillus decaturensis]GBF10321.1 hypothetical protein HK1_00333 [Tepidibacillus sp. HK-1]
MRTLINTLYTLLLLVLTIILPLSILFSRVPVGSHIDAIVGAIFAFILMVSYIVYTYWLGFWNS